MTKVITIGGKEIILTSNGATPIRYKNLFHEDLLVQLSEVEKANDMSRAIDTISQLAFVMAKSAEKADMNTLALEDYIEWLENFDSLDIAHSAKEIIGVYTGNLASTSRPKKKVDPQKEK